MLHVHWSTCFVMKDLCGAEREIQRLQTSSSPCFIPVANILTGRLTILRGTIYHFFKSYHVGLSQKKSGLYATFSKHMLCSFHSIKLFMRAKIRFLPKKTTGMVEFCYIWIKPHFFGTTLCLSFENSMISPFKGRALLRIYLIKAAKYFKNLTRLKL